jgi:hypothetical protein
MKDLLFSVCAASLFSSAVEFLCPKGNEGIGKTLKLLTSICVCACLLFPTVKLLSEEIDFDIALPEDSESSSDEALSTVIENIIDSVCTEMEDYVSLAYGITDPILTLESDCTDPSKIRIICGHLKGKGSLDEAASYISGALGCKITYEEG